MSYDEKLAGRIRDELEATPGITERKMFGGVAFLHRGNMFCGLVGDVLMVRVGPRAHADALARAHAREMDFTGRALTGYVYVDPPGTARRPGLAAWVRRGLDHARTLPSRGEAPRSKAGKAPRKLNKK